KKEQQKINGAQISKLAEICANIEKHYGFPCDIEWGMEKGEFYILQSRPITTL
ncbi:MAG: PEP/pyruvate-binding domain-containing protein, partial [Patescibacteria group bacterium]|nr:PEP/pyruvate-binding domain-containing protein [Patescibacteria group bacterium]